MPYQHRHQTPPRSQPPSREESHPRAGPTPWTGFGFTPERDRRSPCLVFAYGSNLFEARMVARIPSARVLAPAVLPGHDLRFHMRSTDGSGKADAHFTNAPVDQVAGVVYRIEPGELSVLDHYEGGYSRRLHPFHLQGRTNGQPTPAWTYHARPERIDPRLRPFDWYHRFVVEGAQSHRIAPGHVQRLKQVQVIRTGGGPPHPLL